MSASPGWRLSLTAVLGLGLGAATTSALADDCSAERLRQPPSVSLRVDNDLLGGQDEGYTNGSVLTFLSPTLDSFTADPCLPGLALWLNQRLTWLQPTQAEHRSMSFSVAQALFTPGDATRSDLITNDRPYASVLVASIGYHGRTDDWLESTILRVGWVGPSTHGEDAQRLVHKITGSEPFRGWSNQLRDEPVFQVQREWARRWEPALQANGEPRRWDALTRWGASVGTLTTQAIAGAQFRYGVGLPNDFGSLPVWAAGDNAAPVPRSSWRESGWSGHVFLGADAKWVLRNITLDGNTFRDSHSVDKRPLVAIISYGFVARRGAWKFGMARYHSTREFIGQQRRPVFGSFTIARDL